MLFLVVLAASAARAQPKAEADVYTFLLRLDFHAVRDRGETGWSVSAMSALMPTIAGTSAEWRARFDKFPEALRRTASLPSPTRRKRHDASLFPAGTRMISDDQARSWTGLTSWLAVSEVLFTKDGLDALVWVEAHCNGACGQFSYIWLRRPSLKAPWSEAGRVIRVVG